MDFKSRLCPNRKKKSSDSVQILSAVYSFKVGPGPVGVCDIGQSRLGPGLVFRPIKFSSSVFGPVRSDPVRVWTDAHP